MFLHGEFTKVFCHGKGSPSGGKGWGVDQGGQFAAFSRSVRG